MIGSLVKFLPYILVLYFLIRFLKEPIYLLGIPFVIFFRGSIFAHTVVFFNIPLSYSPDLRFLGWTFIVWLSIYLKSYFRYESSEQNKIRKRKFTYQDYIIVVLIIITSIGLVTTVSTYSVIDDIYSEYFTILALFLGYFMVKDIVRYSTLESLSEFLYVIVVINSIASVFYVLHQGLHINIYGINNEYQSFDFNGEQITRSFWFIPVLWFFSISYLLVFKRSKSIINSFLLSINILGIFISYTRSFALIGILIIVLYYLLKGFKSRNVINSAKNLVLVGILGIVFFGVISNLFPKKTDYFVSRFKELDEKPANTESNNLVFRFYRTGEVFDKISSEKVLFGNGSVTEKQMPFVKIMKGITSDMAWAEVVFRWGYIGLALFVLLYLSSIIKTFFIFIKTEGIVSQFALLLFLTIVSQLIESFVSWTFMGLNRSAMGLWYFGIFSALLVVNKSHNSIEMKTQIND